MDVTGVSNATADQSSTNSNQLTGDSFLTLLIAELKSQDPTSPTDPTEMIGQLVGFNSLEQLIEIRQTVQGLASGTGSTSAGTDSTNS